MSFLDTTHKRKSFTLTTALLSALLVLLFYIGLSYLDPPIESGISVNFGTTDYGSGNVQPKEPVKSQPEVQPEPLEPVAPIEEAQPEEAEATPPPEEVQKVEEVVTQNNEESLVIKQQKEAEAKRKAEAEAEAKRKAEAEAKRKAEAEAEAKRKAEEERIRKEQEAKKKSLDALMGGLNSSEGTASGSEGDDQRSGDKGQTDGDPYASSYYGDGSGSGGRGYGLGGRSLTSRDKFTQQCNEQGTVVVEIEVDRSGNVVKTTPGVKGSTNTAQCLLDAAVKTARSFKWNADSQAPSRQVGYVVVKFDLGE